MKQTNDIAELQRIASQVRRDILRMVNGSKSGHPGGSLGCTELLTALYFSIMKHNPDFSMEGKNEDVFFLSNGHISPVWYSVLARSGYFPISEMGTFRKLDSRLQGHPTTKEHLPGVRVATGSLGQGISVAVGMALAKKRDGDPQTVYCLCGDGEMNEGQVWEAALFAHHYKLDNFIGFVDRNGLQIDGTTEDVLSLGDVAAKWKAFGWEVLAMNGNDFWEVLSTIAHAKTLQDKGKPIMIIMTTIMGKGVDYMEGKHHWHGNFPNDAQLATGLAQLEETLGDY